MEVRGGPLLDVPRNPHAALRLLDATRRLWPSVFFVIWGPVSANEEVLGLPSWRDPLGVPVARLDCFLGDLDTAGSSSSGVRW